MASLELNTFLRGSSQRLTTDAVAAATFNEKKWLWVPDAEQGYVAAYVTIENDLESVTVKCNDGTVRI
jgi:myosin protein heavy chain